MPLSELERAFVARCKSRQLFPKSRALEDLGVDDVVRDLAARGPEHPLGHCPAGRPPDVRRRRRPVRRQDDIVQPDQRVVERQRLDVEDIEAGAGDPAIASASASACWSTSSPRPTLMKYAEAS